MHRTPHHPMPATGAASPFLPFAALIQSLFLRRYPTHSSLLSSLPPPPSVLYTLLFPNSFSPHPGQGFAQPFQGAAPSPSGPSPAPQSPARVSGARARASRTPIPLVVGAPAPPAHLPTACLVGGESVRARRGPSSPPPPQSLFYLTPCPRPLLPPETRCAAGRAQKPHHTAAARSSLCQRALPSSPSPLMLLLLRAARAARAQTSRNRCWPLLLPSLLLSPPKNTHTTPHHVCSARVGRLPLRVAALTLLCRFVAERGKPLRVLVSCAPLPPPPPAPPLCFPACLLRRCPFSILSCPLLLLSLHTHTHLSSFLPPTTSPFSDLFSHLHYLWAGSILRNRISILSPLLGGRVSWDHTCSHIHRGRGAPAPPLSPPPVTITTP